MDVVRLESPLPVTRQAWREVERVDHDPDAENPHRYSFRVLERREAGVT